MNATAAFFGAGALLLGSCLLLVAARLAGEGAGPRPMPWRAFARSGSGSRAFRPGRSVLAVASWPSRRS